MFSAQILCRHVVNTDLIYFIPAYLERIFHVTSIFPPLVISRHSLQIRNHVNPSKITSDAIFCQSHLYLVPSCRIWEFSIFVRIFANTNLTAELKVLP